MQSSVSLFRARIAKRFNSRLRCFECNFNVLVASFCSDMWTLTHCTSDLNVNKKNFSFVHEHKARSDDEMETANQLIHFIDLSCLCRAKFIYEKRFGNERERIIQIGLVSVGGCRWVGGWIHASSCKQLSSIILSSCKQFVSLQEVIMNDESKQAIDLC